MSNRRSKVVSCLKEVAGCQLSVVSQSRRGGFPYSDNCKLTTDNCPRAFTVVELLTVIIIMGVLIGILLPVIGRVRQSAYDATTKNEVQQIAGACDQYYNDFKAYPGPVSNTDIESQSYSGATVQVPTGNNANVQSTNNIVNTIFQSVSVSTPVAGKTTYFTSSENLVLGLLGGLWINPSTGNTDSGKVEFVNGGSESNITIPTTLIGTGPQSLVPSQFGAAATGYTANPSFKQYTAYLQASFPGSTMLMNGDGSPENGLAPYHDSAQRIFFDCPIPVFTDQYPDHMPILYIRARVGAHGIISGPTFISGGSATPVPDPTLGGIAHYNYDLVELLPYTMAECGVPPNGGGLATSSNPALKGQHGLQSVSSSGTDNEPDYTAFAPGSSDPTTNGWNHPIPTNFTGNAGQYFMNSSVQPTQMTGSGNAYDYQNATGTPRNKDTYILISAGRDRTYGTGDDVTNFGDVGQ
jgi:type II secretory pathway pseudopilin PulG